MPERDPEADLSTAGPRIAHCGQEFGGCIVGADGEGHYDYPAQPPRKSALELAMEQRARYYARQRAIIRRTWQVIGWLSLALFGLVVAFLGNIHG